MVNKNWFQKDWKFYLIFDDVCDMGDIIQLVSQWSLCWCSFLFLPFGKIPARKILANFARLEFSQNRAFYKLKKLISKLMWLKTELELVIMLYGWLRTKQKSKNESAHTRQPKTSESVIMFFWKKWIYTPLFLIPYLIYWILELVQPSWIGIIVISRRWYKLNFGLLKGKVKSHLNFS